MLAQGILAISLMVRIYDQYGVPAEHLAKARSTAEAIMKAAGVAVTWPRCPCPARVASGELVVRITRTVPAAEPGSLGFSFVDVQQRAGTLATVFADRVKELAAIAGADEGELLGRVIAHEMAHLLVGTREHARDGLMRAEWRADELARQRPSDWRLSRAESVRIRQAIRRRSQAPPTLTLVDAEPVPDSRPQ